MVTPAADDQRAWLHRYGADYATEGQRQAAYRDYLSNRAVLEQVFSDLLDGTASDG